MNFKTLNQQGKVVFLIDKSDLDKKELADEVFSILKVLPIEGDFSIGGVEPDVRINPTVSIEFYLGERIGPINNIW